MKRLRHMRKMASTIVFLLLSTMVFPFTGPPVMAQATGGGLRGVVTDEKGDIIPGAEVTARNTATGTENKSKSNADGLYSFPSLQQGTYLLIVEKEGFKRQELQNAVVKIGQETTIDPVLQAGLASETVTVAAGETLIQKEQVQISNTFESRKVADLPSNVAGGGIDTLALLAPGIVPGFGNVNSNGTTLSVNGNRARSNNFTIDGGDNNDLSIGGPNYFVDNQDIVAEFQVITNNFSAEYGRNQGAIVNIVTKAGTNDYHGTAFWAHRDRKLFDTLTNIERRSGDKEDPTPFLYNVYSGTLGGRIIKDKLFFFGSFQAITGRETAQIQSSDPTIAASDLARLESLPGFASNPALQALRNFSAFAINDIGTIRERTDLSQTDTVTIGGQTFRTAFPEWILPTPFTQKEFSARGDYNINDKNSVWFRQLYQTVDNKNALWSSAAPGFIGNIPVTSKISSAQWTSQVTNTAVNEVRFIYNRLSVIFGGGCDGLQGCIPDPANIEDTFTNITFTGLRNSGGRSLQRIGAATNLPQGRIVTVYQFADNFSKTLGRHQLKTGVDFRRLTNSVPFLPNVNGAFRFPTESRLRENRPSFVNLASGPIDLRYTETDQFYYLNDDWRIRDNLTLNLGLRYEYIGQPINRLNEVTVARETDPSTAIWRQDIPLERRTFPKLEADKNNFAPRIGFAYRPRFGDSGFGKFLFGENDQSVIRGGYSIAYDPPFYNLLLNISTSSPIVFLNQTVNAATGAVRFPLPANPTGAAVQEFAKANNIIAVNTFDPRFFNQTKVSRNFYLPYAQQFSFGIQREITSANVIEARWVATKGTGLFQTLNANPRVDLLLNGFTTNVPGLGAVKFPGFPNLVPAGVTPQTCVNDPATPDNEAACNGRVTAEGLVRSRENTANSIYHSLQTRYQGRIANQLNIGMSYTWSKALDSASEVFSFAEASGTQNPFDHNKLEKSFSGFDRRHAYSLNFIWDVPLFRNQEGVVGSLLGGWQLNGTYFLASGRRFTPTQVFNFAGLGAARSYGDPSWDSSFLGLDTLRPFYGNPNAPRSSVGISQIDAALIFGIPVVDRSGFWSFNSLNSETGDLVAVTRDQVRYIFNGPGAAMIFGTPFGTVPRGVELGKKLNNLNLGVFKNFRLKENLKLRFSFDMFNALNHPNPGVGFIASGSLPDFIIEDAGTDDGFNDLTGVEYSRRAVQFGLKIIF